MPKTVTYEEFLIRSAKAQKVFHDYSTVVWINTKTPVVINCLKHGHFTQLPSSHMQGFGCPLCGREIVDAASKDTQEDFNRKAFEIRGTKYDITRAVYTKSSIPVEIICDTHGPFWMTPNKFLSGRDCPKCSKIKLAEVNRLEAEKLFHMDVKINDDVCDYSLVKYINARTKVEIICKAGHPNFFQTPDSHQRGAGCPSCAGHGFNPNNPGVLYVMQSGTVTKIGITNTSLKKRLGQVNKSSGKNFKVLTFILYEDGKVATDLETELLRKYRKTHKTPTEVYDGYSECFYDVDYTTLLLDIVTLSSQLLPKY